jgi:hypothetical protein
MLELEIDPRSNKLGCAHTNCNTTRSAQDTMYPADGTRTSASALAASSTPIQHRHCRATSLHLQVEYSQGYTRKNSSYDSPCTGSAEKRHMQRGASILWGCIAALKPTWHRIESLQRVRSVEKDGNAGSIASLCGSAALRPACAS